MIIILQDNNFHKCLFKILSVKLIINEFGSSLSKKENRFIVKNKEKKEEYSADQIDKIIFL